MPIRTLVWGENIHERTNAAVAAVYPDGMHAQIARLIGTESGIAINTAVLQDEEHGLSEERLQQTDVLVWWGHKAHNEVRDEIVDRVARHIWQGMGLIVLHSGHFSKIFKRMMGSPCALTWREAGERERLWVVNPGHPIAAGLPPFFELDSEEMYGEPFGVPEPLETVLIGWFGGGEVFRSGITYRRGAGNIFYFQPGHETYPTYHDALVGQVLRNAVHWAHNPTRYPGLLSAPNRPVGDALEPIVERGAKLHGADRDTGFT